MLIYLRKGAEKMKKRPVSKEFINAMESKLEHGRQMGRVGWDSYWDDTTFENIIDKQPINWGDNTPLVLIDALVNKLDEEWDEFFDILDKIRIGIFDDVDYDELLLEGADISNVIMMILDVIKKWRED